jgi:hypothetical protein
MPHLLVPVHARSAAVPPMQVPGDDPVHPPGLSNHLAHPLQKEILRRLQTPLRLHKGVRTEHACPASLLPPHQTHDCQRLLEHDGRGPGGYCRGRLVGPCAVCYDVDLEDVFCYRREYGLVDCEAATEWWSALWRQCYA